MTHMPAMDPYMDDQDRVDPEHPCFFFDTAGHASLRQAEASRRHRQGRRQLNARPNLGDSGDRQIHWVSEQTQALMSNAQGLFSASLLMRSF